MTAHATIQPRPGILEIAPYVGGSSHIEGANRVIKLSANENPLGPSPAAIDAYRALADRLGVYPEAQERLTAAIGQVHGLAPGRIVLGAGSDEIIALLCKAYAGPGDEVLHSAHGFLMYRLSAMAAGASPVAVPERDLTADIDALIGGLTERTRLVFLANPNNPTGTMVDAAALRRLADALPPAALLVIDAAYAEYVRPADGDDALALATARDNVAVTRTFSKIYGLAALRLGWAYVPDHVAAVYHRVRGPFNVAAPALVAGEAAMRDQAYVERCRVTNEVWREWLAREIAAAGLPVVPSRGNFLLVEAGGRAGALDAHLKARGLIARRVDAYGLPGHLRISVGDEEACRLVADAMQQQFPGLTGVAPTYERIALIGLGLIGGSIAWAARRAGAASEIVGTARSAATRARAAEIGFCDRVVETPEEAVAGADLVVLCVPVGVCGDVARAIAPHLAPGATVTDVGSVKRAVIDAMAPELPAHVHFVPGHPLAGTEHSGPDSGFAELFDNRWCLLTPPGGAGATADEAAAAAAAVARLSAFWTALGATVETMDPDHHDLVLAVTSHVPHAIAYTMCGVADDMKRVTEQEVVQFSAAGFRDFTRIAASDPVMWRDVFLMNRDATIEILGRFVEELMQLQRAIRIGDGDFLHAYFTRTRAIRRSIIEAGQDTPAPDFGRSPARPGARSAVPPGQGDG